jgi:RNA-binding protein YhbY
MTPEQKREQILKRALPALVILVLYFAIGSNFVTKKSEEAKKQYTMISQKGINEAILPGIETDKQLVQEELVKLKAEELELNKTLEANSGLLSHGKMANESLSKVSAILKENHLEVLDEKRSDKFTKEQVSKSLRDTEKWLKDMVADETKPAAPTPTPTANTVKTEESNFWTIHYAGNYLDSYKALLALASSGIQATPLALNMQSAKASSSKQEWTLTLWL